MTYKSIVDEVIPDLHQFDRIQNQRNCMAVYLKKTRNCECCLHRMDRPPHGGWCNGCVLGRSKWEWGGWKGKADPDSTRVWCNTDYLFEKYDKIVCNSCKYCQFRSNMDDLGTFCSLSYLKVTEDDYCSKFKFKGIENDYFQKDV